MQDQYNIRADSFYSTEYDTWAILYVPQERPWCLNLDGADTWHYTVRSFAEAKHVTQLYRHITRMARLATKQLIRDFSDQILVHFGASGGF